MRFLTSQLRKHHQKKGIKQDISSDHNMIKVEISDMEFAYRNNNQKNESKRKSQKLKKDLQINENYNISELKEHC